MDAPYSVEVQRWRPNGYGGPTTEYGIYKAGEGIVVSGTDLVLMYKIVELLNEDINGRDIHR